MAQRFTLDRKSFEQFLAAASLVQQFQRQAARSGRNDAFAQPLLELVDTQKAIDSGAMDADSAIERIVRLALRVVGGEGTAVWLFSNDEFLYRAGSGRSASQDERLRLTVLARVAAICEPSRESFPRQREWAKGPGDSGYYPGAARSLVVGPIYQNETVVGALAAFSSAFDAFDHRDAGNIRLLSGLIGNAMDRMLAAHTRTVVSLPRQKVLRLIEQIVPTLQKLVQEKEDAVLTSATPVSDASESVLGPVAEQTRPPEAITAEILGSALSSTAPSVEPAQAMAVQQFEAGPLVVPANQEQSEQVLNTTALTAELARLSRDIEQIERDESIAHPATEVVARSEEAAGSESLVIGPPGVPNPSTADTSLVSSSEAAPAEEPVAVGPAFSIDDTAVPGIGVRAALYDDEKEPRRVWPAIQQSAANTGHFFRLACTNISHGFGRMGSAIVSNCRTLGQRVRSVAAYRPGIPNLPTHKVLAAYRTVQSSLRGATNRARGQFRSLAKGKPELPTLPKHALRGSFTNAGRSIRKMASGLVAGLNSFVDSLPDLPGFPTAPARQQLREARLSAALALKQAGASATRVQRYRLRVRLNGRALHHSASAFVVLLVMSVFLIMESGLFRSDNTAAASARETRVRNAPEPINEQKSPDHGSPAIAPSKHAGERAPVLTVSGPTSHRAVTDPATEDVVQNLTRYEVSTLRRQAESGDEEAAFQLGMAYEIGYDMPQNCAKAAEWVTSAAENGYPAAQYNLGLRYRDGDGVTANASESAKWLSKAAARRYHPARSALAVLKAEERPAGK